MTVELSRLLYITYSRANIGPPDRARAYIDLSSGRVGPRFLLARSVFGRVGPYYLNDRVGLGPLLILALARPETDFGPTRDRPGPSLV